MKWKLKLIKYVEKQIKTDKSVISFCKEKSLHIDEVGIHLAIFTEPFLSLLLEGRKTIESRFSINKANPFQKVKAGDIVFIKRSGGDVCGFFLIKNAKYFHSPTVVQKNYIKKTYSKAIGAFAVKDFWERKEAAKYISIFEISDAMIISPISIEKKDRTAWCVLKNNSTMNMHQIWSS